MPAATTCRLTLVSCASSARRPSSAASRGTSVPAGSTAPERGSVDGLAASDPATSSEWIARRSRPSVGSTSYSIAASSGAVSETSRRDRTRTASPPGERQRSVRLSRPARRSSTRSCSETVPVRTSSGAASTSSRMRVPSATGTSTWSSSGSAYPRSA